MQSRGVAMGLVALGVAAAAVAVAATSGQAQVPTSLSAAERSAVVYMREEEKLARDVYLRLARAYPTAPIFARIARAEQQHMNAVGQLLQRYGIPDPAAGKAAGKFTDPTLQRTYDRLVKRGLTSLDAAIQVGITIEKTDIADIQNDLAVADSRDVERVFTSLLRGSQNHLNAFTRWAQA